ncbi:hypothetical protein KL918_002480 [Ogataea parapolymorpha]|nr:hypothetical protein KL918_002480 [Ogataea parapolymorpha]KAG7870677.1 hypothetical protein KL916_004725 [Ogataea parapolymorpha]
MLTSANRRITVQIPDDSPPLDLSRADTLVSTSSSYYPPQSAIDKSPNSLADSQTPSQRKPLERPPINLSLRRRPPPQPMEDKKLETLTQEPPSWDPFKEQEKSHTESEADDQKSTSGGLQINIQLEKPYIDILNSPSSSPEPSSSHEQESETPTQELFSGKLPAEQLFNYHTADTKSQPQQPSELDNELYFSPPSYNFQNQSSESDQYFDVHETRSDISTDDSINDELYPTEPRNTTLRVQNADTESIEYNPSESSGPLYRQQSIDSKPRTTQITEDDEDDDDSGVSFIAKPLNYTHFDVDEIQPQQKMVVANPSLDESPPLPTYDRREVPTVVPLSHSNVVQPAQAIPGAVQAKKRPPPDNPSTGRGARAVSMSTAQPELFETIKQPNATPKNARLDAEKEDEDSELHKPSLYIYKLRTAAATTYVDKNPSTNILPIAIRKNKGQHSRTASRQSSLFSYQAAIKHGAQHPGLLASEIDDDELPDSKLSHSTGKTKIPQDPDAEVLEVADQLKRLTASDEGLRRMTSVRSVQPPQPRLKLFVANPDE